MTLHITYIKKKKKRVFIMSINSILHCLHSYRSIAGLDAVEMIMRRYLQLQSFCFMWLPLQHVKGLITDYLDFLENL